MLVFGGIPEQGSTILVLRINTNINPRHEQYLRVPIFGSRREWDRSPSSFKFMSMSLRPKNGCITSECLFLVAYERGDWSSLSFALTFSAAYKSRDRSPSSSEFTSTSHRTKNSCTAYECPFLAAYESGDRSPLSSTSLHPKNSRATSKCPLSVFKSGSWFGPLANQNLTVLDRTDGPVQGSP